jgi:uncharacterized protein (TIGR02300 family)
MSTVTDAKPAGLGTKRTCRSCSARFYDLCKEPPVCPKCQAVFDVDAVPELPPLPPEETDAVAPRKKAKKRRSETDSRERSRYDAGDDDTVDPDRDW